LADSPVGQLAWIVEKFYAYSLFPKELFWVSERWLRTRFTDLRYYHQTERGGHFAALEQPDIFVQEVRDGIQALR
jgi:pimeloyl-ACP methyl ester carboxylesterase